MQVIRFKIFALSILLFVITIIIFLIAIYSTYGLSKIILSSTSTELVTAELNDEFLVNTLGCKMSKLPVMSSKIKKCFVPPNKIVCSPPSITKSDECKK